MMYVGWFLFSFFFLSSLFILLPFLPFHSSSFPPFDHPTHGLVLKDLLTSLPVQDPGKSLCYCVIGAG